MWQRQFVHQFVCLPMTEELGPSQYDVRRVLLKLSRHLLLFVLLFPLTLLAFSDTDLMGNMVARSTAIQYISGSNALSNSIRTQAKRLGFSHSLVIYHEHGDECCHMCPFDTNPIWPCSIRYLLVWAHCWGINQ